MKDTIFSRRQIESLIAEGRSIVIFDGQVIKADAWLPYHPGGKTAILHMIGRDGTDEIRALHSSETQKYMQKYVIGRTDKEWRNFVPPIQGGQFRRLEEDVQEEEEEEAILGGAEESTSSSSSTTAPSPVFDPIDGLRRRRSFSASSVSSVSLQEDHDEPTKPTSLDDITASQIEHDLAKYPSLSPATQKRITTKYRDLDLRLRAAGLYQCAYSTYALEVFRYSLLFAAFVFCLRHGQYALSGAFLGLFWHQLVFSAHDAGHMGITHNYQTDTCIGIFIADFLGGLSIGWWKRSHNVHHIVTNLPEHDPDSQLMPFFAISHRFFSSLRSTYYDAAMDFDAFSQFVLKYQHWTYYPILAFGRFNLYVLSWHYLLSTTQVPRKGAARFHRYIEIVGQVFFWYWFGYLTLYKSFPTIWSRVVFVLISHMMTAPLHVQITLSHFAMSTSDLGVEESFPQRMLRTTMDVDCPQWLDFIHGGLQFQAVHHLFPRLPRHNLRAAQKYVKEFCEEVDIPYTIYGFGQGNVEVIGHLAEVAKQVEIFEECRRHAAKELIEGH